jgi:hypothetical protein
VPVAEQEKYAKGLFEGVQAKIAYSHRLSQIEARSQALNIFGAAITNT